MTAEFCTMALQEILDVVCDQCQGINCKNCTYEQVINYASKCIREVEEKISGADIRECWNASCEKYFLFLPAVQLAFFLP